MPPLPPPQQRLLSPVAAGGRHGGVRGLAPGLVPPPGRGQRRLAPAGGRHPGEVSRAGPGPPRSPAPRRGRVGRGHRCRPGRVGGVTGAAGPEPGGGLPVPQGVGANGRRCALCRSLRAPQRATREGAAPPRPGEPAAVVNRCREEPAVRPGAPPVSPSPRGAARRCAAAGEGGRGSNGNGGGGGERAESGCDVPGLRLLIAVNGVWCLHSCCWCDSDVSGGGGILSLINRVMLW